MCRVAKTSQLKIHTVRGPEGALCTRSVCASVNLGIGMCERGCVYFFYVCVCERDMQGCSLTQDSGSSPRIAVWPTLAKM